MEFVDILKTAVSEDALRARLKAKTYGAIL